MSFGHANHAQVSEEYLTKYSSDFEGNVASIVLIIPWYIQLNSVRNELLE